MQKLTSALVLILIISVSEVCAQTSEASADLAAIRQTALDYIEGWYEGNAERMERALHPELAKRIVQTNPQNGRSRLDQMGAMTLVQNTRAGYGAKVPKEQQQKDVTILDVFGNAASVKVVALDWVDYLHVAKFNGRWMIVNVLWELKPKKAVAETRPADSVKSELEALYAKQDEALKQRDFKAFVETLTPHYSVKLLNGKTFNRPQIDDAIKNDMARTASVIKSISTINELTVKGDEAVVNVTHEASRILNDAQGNPHQWDNKVIHQETWVRTSEGWRIKSLEEVEQVYLLRDGQRLQT